MLHTYLKRKEHLKKLPGELKAGLNVSSSNSLFSLLREFI
jgi:hypothetical protein